MLLTGCQSRIPGTAGSPETRFDPNAPAASGHPALPLPDAPSPLTERPPQGLYADQPSPDTFERLATGTLSPDGRFRMAMTGQGAWAARVDGAWLWQIQLPAPPVKVAEDGTPGAAPAPPPPPPPPTIKGSLQWSPQSTLLFLDSNGVWQEGDPATSKVAPLPAALQGTAGIEFSPDGRQVLYYKGRFLFTAQRDGSLPKLVGENLIGHWDSDGNLIITKASQPGSQPGPDIKGPGPGKE